MAVVLLERDALLGQLREMLVAARRGRGRLALLTGEAGIGKTSLVEAFCSTALPLTRILWGSCDPVQPPRPFAPVADIAHGVGGELRRALAAGERNAVLDAFLAEIHRRDAPTTVIVLDDLHWADDATLDLVQVVGRRIARLPVLLIGTYRDHDVAADHPLRVTLGDIPPTVVSEITLPPLSEAAIHRLGRGTVDARAVYEATGGNPFFVSEVLAAGWPSVDGVPKTVRDAVLSRLERLGEDAQLAVRTAAVLGPRAALDTVLGVAGVGQRTIDACVAHALLVVREGTVSFRHELARLAVIDAMTPRETAQLHGAALDALRPIAPTDWARLARHAVGARDRAAILQLAPAAGRAASRLGAHREAVAFFEAALEYGDHMPVAEQADILEHWAHDLALTDDVGRAIPAQHRALAAWRAVGDRVREGRGLTELSWLLWFAGEGKEAMRTSQAAVDLLEIAAPGSIELAWAWAVVAQRRLTAGKDDRGALASATLAVKLAEQLGDERVAVHALTTAAVTEIFLGDPAGWTSLEEAVTRSRSAGLPEETARAIINLVETARDFRRLDLADRYLAEAASYMEDHDLDLYDHVLRSRLAAVELDTGRWDAALSRVELLLEQARGAYPVRARALHIRGLIRARRAMPGAWADLDEALAVVEGDPQDLMPLRAGRAEAAWLDGDDEKAVAEAELGLAVGNRELLPWWWSELAFWGWRAGGDRPLPHPDERPLWLHASGRPAEAAAAWRAIGAPYHEALALSDTGTEADLRRALRTLNAMDARGLARRVSRSLRALGATRIDRGPRAQTRANPGHLTPRQVEVLRLVAEGLGNAEIAARLVITSKTVDHHVSAVLAKLGARNRSAAAAAAKQLGLAGIEE